MKTMLFNPFYTKTALPANYRIAGQTTRRKSPFAGNPRSRNPSLPAATPLVVMNPRRRSSGKKRRHRNPMLPVMANPMRVHRTRRSTRRNPFNVNMLLDSLLKGTVTGGASYLLNKLFISTVGVDRATGADTQNGLLLRQGIRMLVAAGGAYFLPNAWGSAWVGASFYPFAFELDNWWRSRSANTGASTGAASTGAALEAELEAALNGY